jgi:hypothetical protein
MGHTQNTPNLETLMEHSPTVADFRAMLELNVVIEVENKAHQKKLEYSPMVWPRGWP